MSLHFFSIALMAISANTDSFAVAISCGIKKVRMTIGANLTIAIVSSLGTFLSMSIGQMISGYLHRSTANILGSGVLISIGILGIRQTIWQEWQRRRIEKYNQQQNFSVSTYFYEARSAELLNEKAIVHTPKNIKNILGYIKMKDSISLAFSLTINNIGGEIGAGISGLNVILTTGSTFVIAILALIFGANLGEKFTKNTTDFWARILSSSLIVLIGVYEYFN